MHTFLENGIREKRRIRFLTDAKIGVFCILKVVVLVVLSVVLAAVGCFKPCFMVQGRNHGLPMGGIEVCVLRLDRTL